MGETDTEDCTNFVKALADLLYTIGGSAKWEEDYREEDD